MTLWKLAGTPLLLLSVQSFAELAITSPSQACALLTGAGLAGRAWKAQGPDDYGCSSGYREIANASPLPNNLAYFVEGSAAASTQVSLVLNCNQPAASAAAAKVLLSASSILAQQALGAELPRHIITAIEKGEPAVASAGSGSIEVRRDNWPMGTGYEIHVVMK